MLRKRSLCFLNLLEALLNGFGSLECVLSSAVLIFNNFRSRNPAAARQKQVERRTRLCITSLLNCLNTANRLARSRPAARTNWIKSHSSFDFKILNATKRHVISRTAADRAPRRFSKHGEPSSRPAPDLSNQISHPNRQSLLSADIPQVTLKLGSKLRYSNIQEGNDVYFE